MLVLCKGRYAARMAASAADIGAAQRLRFRAFRTGRSGGATVGCDQDGFDPVCQHVLVEESASGRLVCCFRLLVLPGGAGIARSYSAQFYDLAALAGFAGPLVEMGRFCIDPDRHDPDILRVAWGAVTRFVDAVGVKMLFGCSSFPGTDAGVYREAFALLRQSHLAPPEWRPGVKAPAVIRFGQDAAAGQPDLRRALRNMPPLLRTYLVMGGWVSDHAVIDHDMNTLHVFTGLEVSAIPPARARLLRAVAGDAPVPEELRPQIRRPG